MREPSKWEHFKDKAWEVVFEAETPFGRFFDVALLWLIFFSVIVVVLESVPSIRSDHAELLIALEWGFTILFSIEYLLRLTISKRPLRYALSFYGVVDLLSCIPTYLTFFAVFEGSQSLVVVRILRLMRMFRVLKMVHYVRGANVIVQGLVASRAKITVFFFSVLLLSVISGTLLYLIESGVDGSQFTSIPQGIYYAIISITTVGYGDVVPITVMGKVVTTLLVLAGYAIIAVPTGIVTAEMMKVDGDMTTDACPGCGVHGHLADAVFCRRCGEKLD